MKYLSRNILLLLYDIYRKNPTRDPEISYGELFSQTKGSLGHSSDFVESLFEPEFLNALTELDRLGYLRERRLSRVVYYRLTGKGRRDASDLLETTRRDRDRTGQFSSQIDTDYSSPVPTGDFWKWILLAAAAVGLVITLSVKGKFNVPCLICKGLVCGSDFVILEIEEKSRLTPGFVETGCILPVRIAFHVIDGPRYADGVCWWKVKPPPREDRLCEGWVPEKTRDGKKVLVSQGIEHRQ